MYHKPTRIASGDRFSLLCNQCSKKQVEILNQCAEFIPRSSDEDDFARFKQDLEKRYPLCENCKGAVARKLERDANWIQQWAEETHLFEFPKAIVNLPHWSQELTHVHVQNIVIGLIMLVFCVHFAVQSITHGESIIDLDWYLFRLGFLGIGASVLISFKYHLSLGYAIIVSVLYFVYDFWDSMIIKASIIALCLFVTLLKLFVLERKITEQYSTYEDEIFEEPVKIETPSLIPKPRQVRETHSFVDDVTPFKDLKLGMTSSGSTFAKFSFDVQMQEPERDIAPLTPTFVFRGIDDEDSIPEPFNTLEDDNMQIDDYGFDLDSLRLDAPRQVHTVDRTNQVPQKKKIRSRTKTVPRYYYAGGAITFGLTLIAIAYFFM
jgi:hypothetical protein